MTHPRIIAASAAGRALPAVILGLRRPEGPTHPQAESRAVFPFPSLARDPFRIRPRPLGSAPPLPAGPPAGPIRLPDEVQRSPELLPARTPARHRRRELLSSHRFAAVRLMAPATSTPSRLGTTTGRASACSSSRNRRLISWPGSRRSNALTQTLASTVYTAYRRIDKTAAVSDVVSGPSSVASAAPRRKNSSHASAEPWRISGRTSTVLRAWRG